MLATRSRPVRASSGSGHCRPGARRRFFDERERAALALTEAMTRLPEGGVPDDVYAEAASHFSAEELGNLMGAIIAINAWNLVGVATGLEPAKEAEEAAV